MNENLRDAMIKWQAIAREQRSAVNSLFLTYSSALIGLLASIILNKDTPDISYGCIFLASGIAACVSLISGCVVVLARLSDARLTARVARFKFEERDDRDISVIQASAKKFGDWTKKMIFYQVVSFVLAAAAFIIWLIVSYWNKFS